MGEQDSEPDQEPVDKADSDRTNEKPEPDDEAKEKAAEMMTAYEYRPTLILPGTGGAVSGTAVGDWLDDDGNPKYADDEDSPANKAKMSQDDEAKDDTATEKPSEEEDSGGRASHVETSKGEDGKTRGEAAEEREKQKSERSMEEMAKDDKEFNKKAMELAGEKTGAGKAEAK
ncbi:hypothetical protein [Mycobacterium szulgai]|uniref:Uncharacterized protein n=1 Tax=Mycobacterium szulgai TaxID=1787 RepID=A0A1X2EHN8_MYCSZ|nr:hypothetical protein [Mycobacterium szulgai]MCV7074746.1 hypothetical protein [Mycobacterium szulgai]ORX02644.1 hypothetical protein AWC27_28160 [Mycobacterium szulgai]